MHGTDYTRNSTIIPYTQWSLTYLTNSANLLRAIQGKSTLGMTSTFVQAYNVENKNYFGDTTKISEII